MPELLKQTEIICYISVQLFSILPRELKLCILKSVHHGLPVVSSSHRYVLIKVFISVAMIEWKQLEINSGQISKCNYKVSLAKLKKLTTKIARYFGLFERYKMEIWHLDSEFLVYLKFVDSEYLVIKGLWILNGRFSSVYTQNLLFRI